MKESDLLKLLIFIAEEDAQISTIINFFSNNLGYKVVDIKNIIEYGVGKSVFKIVEHDKDFERMMEVNDDEISKIDWSTSNSIQEIYFNDFEHYRKLLFVLQPQLPQEFSSLISEE
jgi:isopentenyldiphosphate isomerase